jgi:hypothetical protein
MLAWSGQPVGHALRPLPKLSINTSRQVAGIIGICRGMFARVGKYIDDNEKFIREVEVAIRDGVSNRDMAAEVRRKALELGVVGIDGEF